MSRLVMAVRFAFASESPDSRLEFGVATPPGSHVCRLPFRGGGGICPVPRASNPQQMIEKSEIDLGSAFFGISEVGFLPYGVQMKGIIEKGCNFDKKRF